MPNLSVFDQHRYAIARSTLAMSDVGARIMGGMTKEEAREFLHDVMGWSNEKIKRYEDCWSK